jgi:hypothetical protein
MNDEAKSALASRVVNRDFVTFAEAQKIGLPIVSFDSFANQAESQQGFGVVSHGVTNLSLTKNLENWWQTKYSLKSHFPQLVKARPTFEGPDEDFNFVIKRLEEDERRRVPPDIFQPPPFFDPRTIDRREIFQSETLDKLEIPVTIETVFDRGADEFYRGIDDRRITWPRALDTGLNLDTDSKTFRNRKAFAVDGYLQVGMRAVYHYEEQEDGSFVHYFTGGVSLAQSKVVELKARGGRVVRELLTAQGTSIFVSDIRTLQTQVTAPDGTPTTVTPFSLFDVPFLAQDAVDESIADGTQLVVESHGNKDGKAVPPDANLGPNGSNFNDMFIVNTSGRVSEIDFAEVTTQPDNITGEGGAITIVSDAGNGGTFNDGDTVSGSTFLVRFVGASFNQIRVNDQVIVKRVTESGTNNIILFCFVVRPKFVPSSAF